MLNLRATRRLGVVAGVLLPAVALVFASAGTGCSREPGFFIQFSDPQFGMYAADSNFTRETANFERAIAAANRLRPAFVVVTGDLVNKAGDSAQIAEYRRIAAQLDPDIPLFNVSGNHDVENVPTPASIRRYTELFGPDRYTFRAGGILGIVVNSSLMHSPEGAPEELAAQQRWLKAELERARREGARHIVIFQHHPPFLASPDEPDQYFNIPRERRLPYLTTLHEFGVHYVFAGHYHRNALARDAGLEVVVSGPVGKPLGDGRSGYRIALLAGDTIVHRFYELDQVPSLRAVRR